MTKLMHLHHVRFNRHLAMCPIVEVLFLPTEGQICWFSKDATS
jgi:hypothetical protein